MSVLKRGRTLAAGLVVGALIGTGVAAVTPAGAAVKSAAASIDWKQVWKKEIKPRADKRYYTKKQSSSTFVKKTDLPSALAPYVTSASLATQLAGYYTKPQVDAALGNYYTKAQSDSRYASATLVRGTFALAAASSSQVGFTEISYPQLSAPPTVHYIDTGAPVPAGCSGDVEAPNAAPGNLCIFEGYSFNMNIPTVQGPQFSEGPSTFGATLWAFSNSASHGYSIGSYAVRPIALAPAGSPAAAAPRANNIAPPK